MGKLLPEDRPVPELEYFISAMNQKCQSFGDYHKGCSELSLKTEKAKHQVMMAYFNSGNDIKKEYSQLCGLHRDFSDVRNEIINDRCAVLRSLGGQSSWTLPESLFLYPLLALSLVFIVWKLRKLELSGDFYGPLKNKLPTLIGLTILSQFIFVYMEFLGVGGYFIVISIAGVIAGICFWRNFRYSFLHSSQLWSLTLMFSLLTDPANHKIVIRTCRSLVSIIGQDSTTHWELKKDPKMDSRINAILKEKRHFYREIRAEDPRVSYGSDALRSRK